MMRAYPRLSASHSRRPHGGRPSGLRRGLIAAVPALLALVACAPGQAGGGGGGAGKIGGVVHVLQVWGGSELDSFNAVLKPFEQQTGVSVQYESTRDIA